MPRRQVTFWERAEKFPPIAVRLMAKHPKGKGGSRYGAPYMDEEIAEAGGLSPAQVHAISLCETWQGIDLPTMRKFLVGCKVDFENRQQMHRIQVYLSRNPRWNYLRVSPYWQTFFEPLIKRLQRHTHGRK